MNSLLFTAVLVGGLAVLGCCAGQLNNAGQYGFSGGASSQASSGNHQNFGSQFQGDRPSQLNSQFGPQNNNNNPDNFHQNSGDRQELVQESSTFEPFFTTPRPEDNNRRKPSNNQTRLNTTTPMYPTYFTVSHHQTTPGQSSTSPDNNNDNQNVSGVTEEGENNPVQKKPKYPENKLSNAIARSVLDLSKELLQRVLSKTSKSYEVVSPISLSSALQLALLGSRGKTYDELISL